MEQNPNLVKPSLPGRKKWYRKWWVITILVFLFITIVLFIIFSLQVYSIVKKLKIAELTNQLATLVNVSADNDPFTGSPNAKVTIIAFEDFQCPYCEEAYPAVKKLISTYGDKIYFVFRDFPLSDVHPQAEKAAEAAECANAMGAFWPMHNKIFENQDKMAVADLKKYAEEIGLDYDYFSNCLDSGKYQSEVNKDLTDGLAVEVNGTPTWFVNGHKLEGALTFDTWKKIIDFYLK